MAWVEKTKSGLRYVDRFKIDGKYKKFSTPIEKDTAQARRRAAETLNMKIRTITHDEEKSSEIALYAAIEDYLELKDCRESTRINATANLKHCKNLLGDMQLSALSPALIRRTFYKADLKPTVINRALSAFKTFLFWCVDMEYLEENPAANVRPLKIDKPAPDPATLYLEAKQLRNLLSNLSGMAYYMTRFLALTGMRIGEASALTPEDIRKKYISVTKSYSSRANETTKPKNSSSIREVFIQPELNEMLKEYMKWRKLDIMAQGIRPKTLFYSRTGEIYREQYYDRIINKLGAHPHILRHTHVALLAEQGISLDAIARRIGHKGTGTIRAVYYHVTEKQRQKDEAALANVKLI